MVPSGCRPAPRRLSPRAVSSSPASPPAHPAASAPCTPAPGRRSAGTASARAGQPGRHPTSPPSGTPYPRGRSGARKILPPARSGGSHGPGTQVSSTGCRRGGFPAPHSSAAGKCIPSKELARPGGRALFSQCGTPLALSDAIVDPSQTNRGGFDEEPESAVRPGAGARPGHAPVRRRRRGEGLRQGRERGAAARLKGAAGSPAGASCGS